ncbi:MAG TPA: phospholipase A, partial [Luteimonas sp.]|nr:phospholipase A [Luteimonas sp.]
MNPQRSAPAALFLLLSVAAPGVAQPIDPTPLERCAAIEVDASRLACYDALARRASLSGPLQADLAAQEARRALQAAEAEAAQARRQATHRDGDLFRHDDDALDDALANVGRGSLLDSRWELARDSKLGIFNFRAYKPLYLLPAFWTSAINETPHSENPDNTVTTPTTRLDSIEAKFQLSFKTKAVENLFGDNGDIWMGYTQSSRWQVYN